MSHAETRLKHSRKAQKRFHFVYVVLVLFAAKKNAWARSLQSTIAQYDIGPTSHCEVIQANRAGRPGEWPATTFNARTQESFRFDGGI